MATYPKSFKFIKYVFCFLPTLFILLGMSSPLRANSIGVTLENSPMIFEANAPYISSSNHLMIPIRTVGEALGLTINWQAPYIILQGKNTAIHTLTIAKAHTSSRTLIVDHLHYPQAIEIKQNISYIKLRVLAEAFGYDVSFKNGLITVAPPQSLQTPVTLRESASFEEKIVDLVNKERAQVGLNPVKMDEALRNVARKKSEDMHLKDYFDHTSPTYGSPFEMMNRFGISYMMAGENIAVGYETPESVMLGWMNSPPHKANILKPEFTLMGVGYEPAGYYWTQMFIRK